MWVMTASIFFTVRVMATTKMRHGTIKKDAKPLRGLIKDAGLTMERFLELKHADKELEL